MAASQVVLYFDKPEDALLFTLAASSMISDDGPSRASEALVKVARKSAKPAGLPPRAFWSFELAFSGQVFISQSHRGTSLTPDIVLPRHRAGSSDKFLFSTPTHQNFCP